jgi:hypothetical protein
MIMISGSGYADIVRPKEATVQGVKIQVFALQNFVSLAMMVKCI